MFIGTTLIMAMLDQLMLQIITILDNTIRSFITTQRELNKEFISRFEKLDAMFEKVENLSIEVACIKKYVQSQRSPKETIYSREN
jgi:hypothetical protein